MFAVHLKSPRRAFHRVFAVNLKSLGGLSQCMRLSRDPSTDSVSVCSSFEKPSAGIPPSVCSDFEIPRRVVSVYAFKS